MKPQKLDSKIYRFIKNSSIAALLFGAALFFYACENDIEKIKAFSSPENLPIIEAKNFETLFTDSGTIRYSLKTTKLLRFENEGNEFIEFPEGMQLIQFDANKNVISSLRADYAKQFVKEQMWEAKNNVVATNKQGDTLKTEHLIWEEKEEKIYTEEFVKIIRPDQIITGVGFTSDQYIQNWKIKNLKGTIFITVDDEGEKKSDSLDIESEVRKEKQPFQRPLKFEK